MDCQLEHYLKRFGQKLDKIIELLTVSKAQKFYTSDVGWDELTANLRPDWTYEPEPDRSSTAKESG